MADIGKAYVQIIPKAEGISGQVEKVLGGESVGQQAGSKMGAGIKKALAGLAIGGTITAGFKAAIDEGSKLEQSFGGLDTIYGKASEQAKSYAMEAAKAGISANDYAEQAVSFGASLKQAFGGDTSKAAEAANTAIMDMTDNAAKMGTPIENIQNAYQGFAKGNYTMLDNLKLGYGGTKTEMERLLADASKLSGQKYDISNLGDVYDAIHVIQGDLGLTGVAAAEASGTFSGSFGAMVASAKNLGATLATGGNIQPAIKSLATNAGNFLFKNLIPMIGNIIKQIPTLIGTFIQTGAPLIFSQGSSLINSLVTGITTTIPQLLSQASTMISEFGSSITSALPGLLDKGTEILMQIGDGIVTALPTLASTAADIITNYASFLSSNLPTIAEKGGEMLRKLGEGLVKSLPTLASSAAKIGLAIIKALIKIVPMMAKTALTLVRSLAKGLGGGALSLVKTAMKKIGDALQKPIKDAQSKIKGIMNKIKNLFPLHIGKIMSGIQLPKITVSAGKSPFGIGGKGTLPSFHVGWKAKGGVFDGPSIIGVGERTPEAAIPLSGSAMRPFAQAIASEMNDGGGTTNNFYITIDGAKDARTLADELMRELRLRVRTA